jgi:hypothetical protein
VGAIHAGYSTVTDYPLGIVKLLPFKAHLAIDALGALALAATPFVTGQWRKGRKHWAPHVALSVFEMCSLALTDPTGKGDFHGNIEGVPGQHGEPAPQDLRRRAGGQAARRGSCLSTGSALTVHSGPS